MNIGIEITERGTATIVSVSGEVDLASAPALASALAEVRGNGGTAIVVDLSAVEFLDSSGLGALVAAHRETVASGGSMRLVRPRPAIDKVLTLTRLTEVIGTYDTLDEALA